MTGNFEIFFLCLFLSFFFVGSNRVSVVSFIIYIELSLMLALFLVSFKKRSWDISLLVYLAVVIVCEACVGLRVVIRLTLKRSSLFSRYK